MLIHSLFARPSRVFFPIYDILSTVLSLTRSFFTQTRHRQEFAVTPVGKNFIFNLQVSLLVWAGQTQLQFFFFNFKMVGNIELFYFIIFRYFFQNSHTMISFDSLYHIITSQNVKRLIKWTELQKASPVYLQAGGLIPEMSWVSAWESGLGITEQSHIEKS